MRLYRVFARIAMFKIPGESQINDHHGIRC